MRAKSRNRDKKSAPGSKISSNDIAKYLTGEIIKPDAPKSPRKSKMNIQLSPKAKNPLVRSTIKRMRHQNHLYTFANATDPDATKGNKVKLFNAILNELGSEMFKADYIGT